MRTEGQGWDDMGLVEEVKVLLRTSPPPHRMTAARWHQPLSRMEVHRVVPPHPTKTILGPQAVIPGGRGFPWSLARGVSAQGGPSQPQTPDFDSGLTSQAS